MPVFSSRTAKGCILLITVSVLSILIVVPKVHSAYLNMTLVTENQIYGLSETVVLTGNLTLGENPVADGLVAIEVRDEPTLYFSFRTVQTGSITPTSNLVNYTQLYPCDSDGHPQYTFAKGSTLWIYLGIKNYDSISHHVTVAISLYDSNNVPLYAWAPASEDLDPGSFLTGFFLATQLSGFDLGTYKIYASAFSNLPSSHGYAYCPEQTATFTVASGTLSGEKGVYLQSPFQTYNTEGTYTSLFRLPKVGRIGTHYVYTGTYYNGKTAFRGMAFPVVLIGDINKDNYVEMMDFFYMSTSFGSQQGDPRFNKDCDIFPWPDGDGLVEMMDFYLLSIHFGDHVQGQGE